MLIYLQVIETEEDKNKFEDIYQKYRGLTLCTLNDTVSHRYTGHTNDRNNSKFSSADAYYAINLA